MTPRPRPLQRMHVDHPHHGPGNKPNRANDPPPPFILAFITARANVNTGMNTAQVAGYLSLYVMA